MNARSKRLKLLLMHVAVVDVSNLHLIKCAGTVFKKQLAKNFKTKSCWPILLTTCAKTYTRT